MDLNTPLNPETQSSSDLKYGLSLNKSIPGEFGHAFTFTEDNLTNPKLTSADLKRIIMENYSFKQLTEDTLRLILKQGAEDNNLLRISEASYTKLIDALDFKLDSSSEAKTTDVIRHVA